MSDIKFINPIQRFIKTESAGGVLLFFVTILALIIANSQLSGFYNNIWKFEIGIHSDNFKLIKPLALWINDGFMAVFFFLIGLEIKREILLGELNSMKKASLPIFAAVGGMVVPLAIFLILNDNPETSKGWGISMATDIAFTLAVLKLLGKRVPLGIKVFLTTFAIIDDLGAVLVIAIFYTNEIAWSLLLYAGILLSILYYLSYRQIHSKVLIVTFGIVIWLLFLKAGVHPTIAGVLLAFAVPIRQKINEFAYAKRLHMISSKITTAKYTNPEPVLTKKQIEELDNLEDWTKGVRSPLQQLEHRLHDWVTFFIMPVFAFSNAGVNFSGNLEIDYNLATNIVLSLFLGKFIGVALFSWISLKLKITNLPTNVTFQQVLGVAVLSGLGFTMSLFIGNLAFFDNPLFLNSAKIGVIVGSLISGILGFILLKISLNSVSSNKAVEYKKAKKKPLNKLEPAMSKV